MRMDIYTRKACMHACMHALMCVCTHAPPESCWAYYHLEPCKLGWFEELSLQHPRAVVHCHQELLHCLELSDKKLQPVSSQRARAIKAGAPWKSDSDSKQSSSGSLREDPRLRPPSTQKSHAAMSEAGFPCRVVKTEGDFLAKNRRALSSL